MSTRREPTGAARRGARAWPPCGRWCGVSAGWRPTSNSQRAGT
ncbi:hypothetical protein MUK42_21338 [Musa troglodytarum]|uniref:Uncharacterized protein n=1 Tax=Musa troglodytarum TaxID=320322 RepID=A0A9E7K2P8_9LILI|nr:hypothetical protein MUK42_21338 [Musa troglodytarum]